MSKDNSHTPQLRFPEFTGEWEEKNIGEIADVMQGFGFPNKYQGQKSGDLPFCKVGDISAAVDKMERIIYKAANYIDYSLLPTLHARPIPVGSTIFAKIGEAIRSNKRIKTGVPCLIDNNAAAVKAKNNENDDFLFYLMSQINLADYAGGIVPSVNKSTIEAIPILFPPSIAEQEQIAECLSAVDALIMAQEHKVQALKERKRGLMQQLFPRPGETTPRLRFPGFSKEWREEKLGEIGTCCAGATPSTKEDKYWKGGTIPWMSSGEVYQGVVTHTAAYITQDGYDHSSTRILPINTVVIALAGQGKTRGTVAITAIELCTNQSLCGVIIKNDKILNKYVYQFLKTRYRDLRSISSGDGSRGGLNLSLIRSYLIYFPPTFEEQMKIAECLSALDGLIASELAKMEALKDFKKGLMQQLFPQPSK